MRRTTLVLLACALFSAPAMADIFSEDFEGGDLSAWTGKGGGAHNGQIVADPLNAGNHVLNFTALNSAGDIFTNKNGFSLTAGQQYTVLFDYLGLTPAGAAGGDDLGGYAGLSEGLAGSHMWYYGTGTVSGAADVLVDDGAWHSYSYDFTPPVAGNLGPFTIVHLMFEDFSGSGGIAGDAYFDNIRLVPVPGAVLLGMLGLSAAGVRLRKRLV